MKQASMLVVWMSLLLGFPSGLFSQTISFTQSHGLGICPDSSLYAWGFARLGDEPGISRKLLPVQVKGIGGTGFLDNVVRVSTVGGTSFAVLADSTVLGWGTGSDGRLGTGNTNNQDFPTPVLGPNGTGIMDSVIAITGEYQSTFVLRADSTLWAWGWNGVGGLGDGTWFNSRPSPVQVIEQGSGGPLDSIVAVGSGPSFGIALDADGTVWAWGDDNYGEIGQNTVGSLYLGAVKVKSPSGFGLLSNIASVDAGDNTAAAVRNDGTVWTWGRGDLGQLGDGTYLSSDVPVQVKDPTGNGFLTGIETIKVGENHVMALDSSGILYGWGNNEFGQLATPSVGVNRSVPIVIPTPGPVAELYVEAYSTFLVLESGEVYMWGYNISGNAGNGDELIRIMSPLPVLNPTASGPFTSIASLGTGYEHNLAVTNTGNVAHWGDFALQLPNPNGNGIDIYDWSLPVIVPDTTGNAALSGITKVSGGEAHTVALSNTGLVYGWGSTANSQIGVQNVSYEYEPITIKYFDGSVLDDVRDLEASSRHSVFLMNDSTVRYVGFMQGATRAYPWQVPLSSGGPPLSGVVDIAAGLSVTLVVDKDSAVWAWGLNFAGQLGTGTTQNSFYPTRVLDPNGTDSLSGIVAIDMMEDVILALDGSGRVFAWGENGVGQLGTGDNIQSNLPRMVRDSSGTGFLDGITAIAAGELHCLALADDSTVWVWGLNVRGNFGDSTLESSYLPTKVLDGNGNPLKGVVGIDVGTLLSSFLMADGTILSCGFNLEGQTGTQPALGQGTPTQTLMPCRVFGPQAGFTASQTTACAGDCIQFTDTSLFSPSSWSWEFAGADVLTSTDPSPIVCYSQPGTYAVTLIVSNNSGEDSLISQNFITIAPRPEAVVTPDTALCIRDTLQLLATGASQIQWSGGGGLSCTSCPDPVLEVLQNDTFIVTVTNADGCSDQDTVEVEALSLPVPVVGNDSSVCPVIPFQLSASGGGSYQWNPAPTIGCQDCPDPFYSLLTDTEIILTVTNQEGCSASDSVFFSIIPDPVADFSIATDTAAFTITTTDLSSNADLIIWEFGDGQSDTAVSVVHTYAPGAYELCMITVNDCARDTMCIPVSFQAVNLEDEFSEVSLTISPNPASDLLSVDAEGLMEDVQIHILNLEGKLLESTSMLVGTAKKQLEVSHLPEGIYLLQIQSDSGQRIGKRFVILR